MSWLNGMLLTTALPPLAGLVLGLLAPKRWWGASLLALSALLALLWFKQFGIAFWPLSSSRKLLWLICLAPLLLTLSNTLAAWKDRSLLLLAGIAGMVWLAWPLIQRNQLSPEHWAAMAGLLVCMQIFSRQGAAGNLSNRLWYLWLWALSLSGVAFFGASALLAQVFGSIAAGLFGLLIACWFRPPAPGPANGLAAVALLLAAGFVVVMLYAKADGWLMLFWLPMAVAHVLYPVSASFQAKNTSTALLMQLPWAMLPVLLQWQQQGSPLI